MKLNTTSKALSAALETLRPLYSSRTTLPAVSNVLLRATNRKLTLSANDLDMYCQIGCAADIHDEGEIAVVGSRLLQAVKYSVESEISIEVKGDSLHYSCGESSMRISGLPVAELPAAMTLGAPTSQCRVAGEDFARMLAETLPFVSNDSGRPILNGILFQSHSGKFHMVATEGHMLSSRTAENVSEFGEAVIPTKACRMFCSLAEGEVSIGVDENMFSASAGDIKIVGRQIAGKFPSWRPIVPVAKEQKVRVRIERAAILSALPFLAIADGAFAPWVNVDIEKNGIVLHSKASTGECRRVISAKVDGNGFKTCFEMKYLQAVIEAHSTDELTLLFRDPVSPLLIEQDGGQTVVLCQRIK